MSRWYIITLLMMFLVCNWQTTHADEEFLDGDPPTQLTNRTALVIGVGAYDYLNPLGDNPRNDAKAVARTLQAMRFERGDPLIDPTRNQILAALEDLQDRLSRRPGLLLIYFAGHGLSIGDRGFLVPKDARLKHPETASDWLVPIDLVYREVLNARPRATIIIIDACRDNPFNGDPPFKLKLAAIPPQVDLRANIFFSVPPQDKAPNGATDHSPFTEIFLKLSTKPHLDVVNLFDQVAAALASSDVQHVGPTIKGLHGPIYLFSTQKEFDSEQAAFKTLDRPEVTVSDLKWFIESHPAGYLESVALNEEQKAKEREAIKRADIGPSTSASSWVGALYRPDPWNASKALSDPWLTTYASASPPSVRLECGKADSMAGRQSCELRIGKERPSEGLSSPTASVSPLTESESKTYPAKWALDPDLEAWEEFSRSLPSQRFWTVSNVSDVLIDVGRGAPDEKAVRNAVAKLSSKNAVIAQVLLQPNSSPEDYATSFSATEEAINTLISSGFSRAQIILKVPRESQAISAPTLVLTPLLPPWPKPQ